LAHPSTHSSLGKPFIELQSVDSTNNYARSLIHQEMATHGTAIFAQEQLAGKGQRGKQWLSEAGTNLILSMIIEPRIVEITDPFQLNACITLAAQHLLSNQISENIAIKWPNDLYYNDKKIGGVLLENIFSSGSTATWKWAIAGIGININQTKFPEELPNPVSLKQITEKDHDPVQLAKTLCEQINEYLILLKKDGFDKVHDEYNQKLYKRGQLIKLKKSNRSFEAKLKAVSSSGKLIVQHSMEEEFGFEEVEWLFSR
jgi:BirA family biotin operon repressor/biotin-[acetyl-CoA-carboxylase] ligase